MESPQVESAQAAATQADTASQVAALRNRQPGRLGLNSREVNLLLAALYMVVVASGVVSWIVALDRAWILTSIHASTGFALIAIAPFKLRGSVRVGFRRGRLTRWISAGFGVMVCAGVVLGFLHSTRIWFGLGYWEALWTHLLLGFVGIPLFVWHVVSRPQRAGRTDLNRRSLLTSSIVVVAGISVWGSQKAIERVVGSESAQRAGTGSHEIASFMPDRLPAKQWINDTASELDPADWRLRIEGEPVAIADVAARCAPRDAWIDCTDGWRSEQRWDVVALSELLSDAPGRSVKVKSATGYDRLFAREDANEVFLCVGYGGVPLHRRHGAPVRIVAPNRRGPWWIKWVADVELSDRPAWLQLPFPAT